MNDLLVEMDGFEENKDIFFIASTNFPENLDPALTRSGRFDKVIHVNPPTMKGRKKLLSFYLKAKKLKDEVSIDHLSQITMDFTGSDIKNFVNLSSINAIKHQRKELINDDFIFASDRMNIGVINKSLEIT